jgi:O-antigen/teichoic acid export membrane protein
LSETQGAGVRRLARNSAFILVARASSLIARFVVTMVLARYLGRALFGDYNYVTALVGSFEWLADLGLNQIAIREIAKQRDRAGEYFGNALILKAITSLIALIILGIVANTAPAKPHVKLALYLYGISAILNYLVNTYFVLYRALERMQYQALLVLVERGLYVLLLIVFVSRQASFVSLFWANMITVIVKLVVGMWINSTRFTLPKFRLDLERYKEYMREALPVGIGLIIASVSVRIDIVLLGFLQSSDVVGAFSGPYRIVDAVGSMSAVLIVVLFPIMARRAAVGTDAFGELLQKAAKVMLLLGIPVSIGLIILARPATLLVLGGEFAESAVVLRVLALVVVPIYINRLLNFAFISINRQSEYALITGFALILNVIIDLMLIPSLGYWGATIGVISAECVRLVLSYWRINRQVEQLHLWHTVKRLMIPNLALAAVLLALAPWSWPVAAVVGATAYLALILLGDTLDQDERRALRQALGIGGYLSG